MDQGLTDKQAPGHLPGILLALQGILALLGDVDTDTDYVQCQGTIRSQQGLLPIVQSVGQSYGLCKHSTLWLWLWPQINTFKLSW